MQGLLPAGDETTGEIKDRSEVKGRYQRSRTPCHRLIKPGKPSEGVDEELIAIYFGLNPAKLKQEIDAGLEQLSKVYGGKRKAQQAAPLTGN